MKEIEYLGIINISHMLFITVFRLENNTLWFLKQPHCEAKRNVIYSVKISGGFSSMLAVLATILMSDCVTDNSKHFL